MNKRESGNTQSMFIKDVPGEGGEQIDNCLHII